MCNINPLPSGRPDDHVIVFGHNGQKYQTDKYAFVSEKIVLPDGQLIKVTEWGQGIPPKVIRFEVVSHGMNDKSQTQLAALLNAATAQAC